MKLFGGFSFPLFGRARAGVSWRGRPWLGARSGLAGTYVGVLSSPSSQPLAAYQDSRAHPALSFYVDERGRVFLGDSELDLEGLRKVVSEATLTRNARIGQS